MSDKSIVIRIKAIIKACEEARNSLVPTLYETAEAVAYERIRDLINAKGGLDE